MPDDKLEELQAQVESAHKLLDELEHVFQKHLCEHEMIFIGQGLLTKEFRCNKCGLIKEE